MIELEESIMIHIVYKQGYSKKAIARKLGMSINTVRKYIKTGGEPIYTSRGKKPTKLDSYKPYIRKRLRDAHPHWVPSSVIFREIVALGYPGGRSQLRAYMSILKPKSTEPLIRFETEPGYQMQVDWAKFRGGTNKLSAFIATLGYSRACYVEFVSDEQLETLISCHEHAFEYFGGIPKTILYDNMKTVILTRNAYAAGLHRFQPGFWDYAKDRGFMPKVCQPYRAQTKGKVERFIHYLRHSFYYPLVGQLNGLGLTVDKETANIEVLKWLNNVANQRIHATTEAIPFERLSQEQGKLSPLPSTYLGKTLKALAFDLAQMPVSMNYEKTPFQHDLSVYQKLLDQAYEEVL